MGVGAGFAGLQAAKSLARANRSATVTIIDRHNYHTFTPLLYQVATASLEPEGIAYPIRTALRAHRNVSSRVADVVGLDLRKRLVETAATGAIQYDYLILAAGSSTNFFDVAGAEEQSHALKDLPEALVLRNDLLNAVERAAVEPDIERRRELLSIVVVGGGPTGVELAGAIAELTRAMIARDFPSLNLSDVRINLVEAGDRLLHAFHPSLSAAALRFLRRRGVQVRLNTAVESVEEDGVRLHGDVVVSSVLVIWAAGVHAAALAGDLGVSAGSAGRVGVLPRCSCPITRRSPSLETWPLRQGDPFCPRSRPSRCRSEHTPGSNVARQIGGLEPLPIRYIDRGTMATLGRSNAVAQVGWLRLTGFPAWIAWLGLHLVGLIGFRNRLLVLVNWAWEYFFFRRGARAVIQLQDTPSR